jgi:hypothetical protein
MKKKQPSILDAWVAQMKVHAELIGAGVHPDSALNVAFGQPAADQARETIKKIEEEKK